MRSLNSLLNSQGIPGELQQNNIKIKFTWLFILTISNTKKGKGAKTLQQKIIFNVYKIQKKTHHLL